MPQDTIWLNNEKTQHALRPVSEATPASKHTSSTKNTDAFKEQSDYYSSFALPASFLLLALIWIIIKIRDGNSKGWVEIGSIGRRGDDGKPVYEAVDDRSQPKKQPYLQYKGRELNFAEAQLVAILKKRSPFFTKLNPFEKERFLKRLKKFIVQKNFNIHDKSGFKEMPILISASAIQLSFGLENYLLPDFPVINIFPEEFLGLHPNIRFLEGNVSDGAVNISWKHFLTGFSIPDDGQNVGLHEMAHAYYYQNLHCRECEDKQFKEIYPSYEQTANKVYEQEQKPGYELYSEYAMRNFQEFWAESVEIFFEKPLVLKSSYPALYKAICSLLKQDTATH